MLARIKYAASLLAVFAASGAAAYSGQEGQQSQPAKTVSTTPAVNLDLVILDPAHGGPENGATLGDHLFEKDVTLAFAGRLRPALTAGGFTAASTRDGDPAQALTTDQRAGFANRAHAVACILIHATRSGAGVHMFASTLQPPPAPNSDEQSSTSFVPIPWESAQAASVDQSLRMAGDLRAALAGRGVQVTFSRASVAPLDNLMCPAVAVEIAPLEAGADATPIRDDKYQQKIVDGIVSGLTTWRKQVTADNAGQGSAASPRTPKSGVTP